MTFEFGHFYRKLIYCLREERTLLGVVIALLFAILVVLIVQVACDNGEPSDDGTAINGTPVAGGLSGEFSDDQFGGPYPFAQTGQQESEKKLDFDCYLRNDLSLSQAVRLTEKLFKDSIKANYKFPNRTDTEKYDTQKYNFVIDEEGKIIVAKWTDIGLNEASANAVPRCKGRRCEEVGGIDLEEDLKGKMVNWFPEDETAVPQESPCWLNRDKNKEGPGLLDAISKHFMLAQGYRFTIDDFVWTEWLDKRKVKVAYAGELTVDVVNCTYSLNNDSGTYGPPGDTLAEVAKHFAKEIHVGPSLYVDVVFDVVTTTKSRVTHSTDNLFITTRKISNAPPVCP